MRPPTSPRKIADWIRQKEPNETHGTRVSFAARGRRGASGRKYQRSNSQLQGNMTNEIWPPMGPSQIADWVYQKEPNETVEGVTKCQDTIKVNSSSTKQARCPDACPYFAQAQTDGKFRTLRCVASAEECKAMDPKTPIADKKMKICRSPTVESCREHHYNGTDACKFCHRLYALGPDGQCHSHFKNAVCGLGVVFGVLFLFIGVWINDWPRYLVAMSMRCRRRSSSGPAKNCETLHLLCNILHPRSREAAPAHHVLGAAPRRGKARS